jgi:dynein heavy chain
MPGTCLPLFCRWYDDFNAFKAGVRDLEVMLENVLELALDSAPSLSAR